MRPDTLGRRLRCQSPTLSIRVAEPDRDASAPGTVSPFIADSRGSCRARHVVRVLVLALAASIVLTLDPRPAGAATPPCPAVCRGESMVVLLVSGQNHPVGVTPSQVTGDLWPQLSSWFHIVSYGTFAGWNLTAVGSTAAPLSDLSCDLHAQNSLGLWAINTLPHPAEHVYVVIYPSSWSNTCQGQIGVNPNNPSQYVVLWSDAQVIHTSLPTPTQMYETMHEMSHSIFGVNHADALDCQTSFSASCLSAAEAKQDPFPCVNGNQTLPVMCQYGDPWDPLGNDWPGQLAGFPYNGFSPPAGEPWPNGVEMDAVGWLATRKQNASSTVSGVYPIAPLETQNPGGSPQVLFIPPTNVTPWLEVERRAPPAGTSVWTDGYLSGWPSVTDGILIHIATNLGGRNNSALLDASPGPTRPPSARRA